MDKRRSKRYDGHDSIAYTTSYMTSSGRSFLEITCYDNAFSNAVFSDEMLKDYYKHSYKCSRQESPLISHSVERYKIYTDYDIRLENLNKRLKAICKIKRHRYKPYKLYIVKWQKSWTYTYKVYYHLHNDVFDHVQELYSTDTLENLFNAADEFLETLMPTECKKTRVITNEDKKRLDIIDNEIERATKYIESLKQLKKL